MEKNTGTFLTEGKHAKYNRHSSLSPGRWTPGGVKSIMKITVEALVDNLGTVLEFVDGQLEEHGCPMRAQYEIDVAVEELFVNVASYAYETGVGSVTIEMTVEENPKTAVIQFTDRGIPYNPAAKEDPDVTLPADQREIGGLGIYMVKKSMDRLDYEYKDGQNIVTIRKTIK